MAFKFLTELKNIVSVGEALDTLSRLVAVSYTHLRAHET